MAKNQYHHGDLAETLVKATRDLLRSKPPTSISLREVAKIAGVSHGAPAHHFGGKAGLFTAVAIAGHHSLATALEDCLVGVSGAEKRLFETGKAYIQFAVEQPAYFSIMFQTELLNAEDGAYTTARAKPKSVLRQCIKDSASAERLDERQLNGVLVALWSQVHGFAQLWLTGNLGDPNDTALLQQLSLDMLGSLSVAPHINCE
ncbi:MAG: TetR/AcrR family transcriptional regulator [Pseudomonadales bacterium]|nr:TetR/AcrR family transcriptional regulator [Pseudomonadales bacterium]